MPLSSIRARRRALAVLAVLAFALVVLPPRASAQPAPDAREYAETVGWLLGLHWTPAQQTELQRHVDGYVGANDTRALATIDELRRTRQLLLQQPQPLRATALEMGRPDILLGLHAAARDGARDSQWLLDQYYAANPPLATGHAGGLPLTRAMVDAQLDLQHFVLTEIHRRSAVPADARIREQAYRTAAATHASLTAEQQVALARQPGELARTRYGWGRASEIDRTLTRAEMGAALTPQEQAAARQVLAGFGAQLNGMVTQHRDAMLGGMIRNMQQNSDLIMGRGTVWNPATNRWEQQGGIVTEYNGTVRVP